MNEEKETKKSGKLIPQTLGRSTRPTPSRATRSKKQRIISLYESGTRSVDEIAEAVDTSTSYVAAVLRDRGYLNNYFDLYTATSAPMNVYTQELGGRLGYRDLERAQESIETLEEFYEKAKTAKDRPAQHHALVSALTLFDRARFSQKLDEAGVFRTWIVEKLYEEVPPEPERH